MRHLTHLNDPDAALRLGLGLELPPPHIVGELRAIWWRWRGRGFRLPAQWGVIQHPGGRW